MAHLSMTLGRLGYALRHALAAARASWPAACSLYDEQQRRRRAKAEYTSDLVYDVQVEAGADVLRRHGYPEACRED